MSHCISGIITSFKYSGELPNIVLIGNFCFIPINKKFSEGYIEQSIHPYDELTRDARKLLKEMSFKGKCAYIETDFFGGSGIQKAELWEDGIRVTGPLISYHGIKDPDIPEEVELTDEAVNFVLKSSGIKRKSGSDEFDTARLGFFRSNKDIITEYNIY